MKAIKIVGMAVGAIVWVLSYAAFSEWRGRDAYQAMQAMTAFCAAFCVLWIVHKEEDAK